MQALELWNSYAPRFCLDIGLLIDFWVYLQRRGANSMNERSLDAVYTINRYYGIWRCLETLTDEEPAKASVERIWDHRMRMLRAPSMVGNIQLPSSPMELEICLNDAFERSRRRL
jgi:hypothetical protein